MQPYQHSAANEHRDCQIEQGAAVALHFDAEFGQVRQDGPADDTERQHRAQPNGARPQQQRGCDKFDHARSDAAPGFGTERCKNPDAFGSTGEFEQEGLEQNGSHDEAQHEREGDFHVRTFSSFENNAAKVVFLIVRQCPVRNISGILLFKVARKVEARTFLPMTFWGNQRSKTRFLKNPQSEIRNLQYEILV
jgi:hypothetical protein